MTTPNRLSTGTRGDAHPRPRSGCGGSGASARCATTTEVHRRRAGRLRFVETPPPGSGGGRGEARAARHRTPARWRRRTPILDWSYRLLASSGACLRLPTTPPDQEIARYTRLNWRSPPDFTGSDVISQTADRGSATAKNAIGPQWAPRRQAPLVLLVRRRWTGAHAAGPSENASQSHLPLVPCRAPGRHGGPSPGVHSRSNSARWIPSATGGDAGRQDRTPGELPQEHGW